MKSSRISIATVSLLCLLVMSTAVAGKKGEQWYMKMTAVVEDGEQIFYDDRSGIFGRLEGAKKNLDRHDIPVFARVNDPEQPASIAIVFETDQEGEDKAGRHYLSNYKAIGDKRQVWDFTIYSGKYGGDVTLYWNGVYTISGEFPDFISIHEPGNPLLGELSLVDRETGEVIPATTASGGMNIFEFNMAGKPARYFRWVQGKLNSSDLKVVTADYVDETLNAASSEGLKSKSRKTKPEPPGWSKSPAKSGN